MDSPFSESQPTQLLQHALAPQSQEQGIETGPASPNDGTNSVDDFSLDSRIIPCRTERVLAEDSQKETRQKDGKPVRPSDDAPVHGSGLGSDFILHGDNPFSATVGKVIGTTATASFHSPPTTRHSLPRQTKSMPVGNRRYRRSPSLPSQDSFAGPVSQDPAELYLASTKQFNVPLSDLGETPTQEVIHSPTDPETTLPDASEHKEFLEEAMRKYDEQRANRLASNHRPNILVVATPNNSGEFSELVAQESRFEFNDSSSFDKMLERGLADPPDSTPTPAQIRQIDPPRVDTHADTGDVTKDAIPALDGPSPLFEWIAPSPSCPVASSNPRSLLRMVHPDNRYRIAKMRRLAGEVEPPSYTTTGAETQSSHMRETQPCITDESSSFSPTRTTPRQFKVTGKNDQDDADEPEDSLDVVPDSEPLRAGSGAQVLSPHQTARQSPLKKTFSPLSPMSEHGSGEDVPDSLATEGSEASVPLVDAVLTKNTKGCMVPTRHMSLQESKRTTATSKPPASKNSKAKPSKAEPTEVPTSLPEQDLHDEPSSSRRAQTRVAKVELSRKKQGKDACGAHDSSVGLRARKHVACKKRPRRSDTESSEDPPGPREKGVQRTAQKQEEEESESADEYEVASPQMPPLKLDPSRNKRRRAGDVNATRGTSKAPTSARNSTSDTPAVTTRSAKRLRSGVSSVRGLTTEPATHVFALWKQDGHYYSGVVHSCALKNKYLIKFDDGTEDEVELKNMRRRELLAGDRVIIIQDNVKSVVVDVSHADSRGLITLEADDGNATTSRSVGFGSIRIANRTIQNQWKKRTITVDDIVTLIKPKPPIDPTPSRESVTSAISSKVRRELVKTGFVVTINPKNEKPDQMKDEAMRAIKQHGGLVIEDWSSVFTMMGKHSQSNKRWIATPHDFRWKPEVALDRVFLLSDDAHQKPKFLLALALGIPCLSFDWLTKGREFSSDWQPFLLSAGYSDLLGARISQRVDLDWGNCTEHLTDIMDSEVPTKLFSRKTVLCIGPELVPLPPSRSKKNNSEEASRYVPWIILCMGAAKVEAITDTKQITPVDMQNFDYIIVKDRDILGSLVDELGDNVVVGDVSWVKECLVSSRLSRPELE